MIHWMMGYLKKSLSKRLTVISDHYKAVHSYFCFLVFLNSILTVLTTFHRVFQYILKSAFSSPFHLQVYCILHLKYSASYCIVSRLLLTEKIYLSFFYTAVFKISFNYNVLLDRHCESHNFINNSTKCNSHSSTAAALAVKISPTKGGCVAKC